MLFWKRDHSKITLRNRCVLHTECTKSPLNTIWQALWVCTVMPIHMKHCSHMIVCTCTYVYLKHHSGIFKPYLMIHEQQPKHNLNEIRILCWPWYSVDVTLPLIHYVHNIVLLFTDTAFMFIIAGLLLTKVFQNRHPDLHVNAFIAFFSFAVIIFFTLLGIVRVVSVLFSIFLLFSMLSICTVSLYPSSPLSCNFLAYVYTQLLHPYPLIYVQ